MAKNVELYHIAPDQTTLMQCQIIKTENDKIIVIDGGFYLDRLCYYIHSAIRAILGLEQNDYFEIEAWILTHCHGDHYGELALQFERYGKDSNFKVNNIYFDFAPFDKMNYTDLDDDTFPWYNGLIKALDNYASVNGIALEGKSYFDELNGKVINSDAIKKGLTLNIDGVKFDFYQTYDFSDQKVNGSSLVFKMTVPCGEEQTQTVLFLGDTNAQSGKRLLKNVEHAKLKADIVQMAHHGNWAVEKEVYDVIGATVHLWSTPIWLWTAVDCEYDCDKVREWVGAKTHGKFDIVSSCYERYPNDRESVDDWKGVLDQMKIVFPYNPTKD